VLVLTSLALGALIAACSSKAALTPDGGTLSNTAGTRGEGGPSGSGQDAATEGSCPATVPMPGEPCTPSPWSCGYGGEANHACATHARCSRVKIGTTFQWEITPPAATCGTHPSPCPDTFTSLADGSACPVGVPQTCDYALGRCGCVLCTKGAAVGNMWACRPWDTGGGDGCPALAPLMGEACATPSYQTCLYGGCTISVGDDVLCVDGAWRIVQPQIECDVRSCAPGI
jgi:hypothetical protein